MRTGIVRRIAHAAVGLAIVGTTIPAGGVALAAGTVSGSAEVAPGTDAKLHPAEFGTAATASVAGLFPGGVVVADFTGDSKPDVAVAVSSVGTVPGLVIVPGDGRGGFRARLEITLPGNAQACDIAAGDLNSDGKVDLAVTTCGSGSSVVLLTGHGDGTFDVAQQINVGSAIAHPAIGLLNADRKADLAVVREQGGLSVYFGQGDGTVGAATNYPDMSSDTIRAVDATGDGLLDLSFTGPTTMVNLGGGVFAPPVGADFFAVGSTLADLDGDGILDGAGVDASGRHVLIGRGEGDGTYQLIETITLDVQQTLSIAGGDFTGDGKADLIVNGDRQLVYLLAGRGDGTVQSPVGYATGPHTLTAADLGGSSAADLVSLSDDPGTVYGVLGGRRGLGAAMLVDSTVTGEIALGDVNGDGRIDAVTSGADISDGGDFADALGAHLNRGKGKFGPTKTSILRSYEAGSGVAALRLVDVNSDGKLDAVGGFENFQFRPSNVFIALGNGDGTFAAPLLTNTGDPATDVLDVAVGDVTGDGNVDVIATTGGAISVLPGKGDGTFRAAILSGVAGQQVTNTMLGDVTGDGVLDAVVTIVTGDVNVSSSDLVVERGDNKGHFTEAQRVTVDTNIFGAVLGDLNGDKRPDLAAVGRGGTDGGRGGLHVLINGAGTLQTPTFYPYGGTSLVGADFNVDGTPDLATSALDDYTWIGLNPGNGTFVFGPRIPTTSGPATAADVTGDGAPDLFAHPSASPRAFGLAINEPWCKQSCGR